MHPAIARLVSATFYDGALLTDKDCEQRYSQQAPPFAITAQSESRVFLQKSNRKRGQP